MKSEINDHDFTMIHEAIPHGDLRFHIMLHEFTSDLSRSERVSSHWHEEYELLVVTDGQGSAHINNRRFEIRQKDILFINSGNVHSLSAEPGIPLVFYAIDFGRELISSYGNDDIQQKYMNSQISEELIFRDHFRSGEPSWEKIFPLLDEIRSQYIMKETGFELLIKSDLLRIWYYLCKDPATSVPSSHRNNDAKIILIKEILQYIQKNYGRSLTLQELASRFHMSEGQFCRFFKSQVNMTAIEYLNYYRIGAACDMLRDSASSVSTIALNCGYNNISYFNRSFRKYMHCTPKEYRERITSLPSHSYKPDE